jgi:hypothetical protein
MVAFCTLTTITVNALFTGENAVPVVVVYKDAPALLAVNPQQLAKELLEPKQYKCFNNLIQKESRWNDSKNKKSSAQGVGQLLDSTYRNLGMRHPDSKAAQTVAALAYIGRKYGSGGPCAAWAFWQKQQRLTGTGWY